MPRLRRYEDKPATLSRTAANGCFLGGTRIGAVDLDELEERHVA